MFAQSAAFYDQLYGFMDYEAAVRKITAVLDAQAPDASSLLDVGCGTGRHLELLRQRYEVEGLDLSPAMLSAARQRCPGVAFHEADMADFELPPPLRRRHLPVQLDRLCPHRRAHAQRGTQHAQPSQPRRPAADRAVVHPRRLLDRNDHGQPRRPARPEDRLDVHERTRGVGLGARHPLPGGAADGIERFEERQELGLFTEQEHLGALRDAGLQARHESDGPFGRGLYVAWDATS